MAQATGGTLQYAKIGSTWYRTHIFTQSDSFVVTEAGNFRYLCVAGGGGGGNDMGGGGGGGGVLNGSFSLSTGSYTITVGAGGNGAPAGTGGLGTNGENSSIGSLVETIGGGRGASQHNGNTWNAGNGGSGGGGSGGRQSSSSYGGLPGTGTPGQGFNGAGSGPTWYPGGGGGAGGAGVGAGSVRGHGGPGKLDDILGIEYYWGGGGGGSGYSTTGGDGGIGGGGGGAVNTTSGGAGYNSGSPGGGGSVNSQTNRPGGNGGANTGGGGGGGSHYNSNNNGGAGGSGIVILSYEIPPPPNAVGTGGIPYLVEQDGAWYLAHVFLESGTFTATNEGILEYLIVAGGGGGGGRHGGGGGGGGLISGLAEVLTQSYTIVVGAGATGAQTDVVGGTGTNSTAFGLIAVGGGGGGSYTGNSWSAGTSGGSGGGGGTLAGSSVGQGFSGGVRSNEEAGGGGGAGGVGENGGTNGGNGGPGKTNTILGGNSVTGYKWAGGGGGASWQTRAGDGGVGGGGGGGAGDRTSGNEGVGGSGGYNPGQRGTAGTFGATSGGAGGSNTGGGGGGSGQRDYQSYTGVGGNGGSGIVIVRYLISTPTLADATGGEESQYELTPGKWYKVHTFKSDGNLEISQAGYLQYLVVAGGGGGGASGGGGGGAGGLLTGFFDASTGTYSVTVGPGGTGAPNSSTAGTTGTNSSFHNFIAIGGGGGTSRDGGGSSTSGGSGGGGAGGSTRTTGASGTVTQGNNGGLGFDSTTNSAGGGGGGSATPGTNGGYQLSGRGGDGTLSSISGSIKYYAGGGGGGITTNGTAGAGGLGGGGTGGVSTTSAGTAGESNTGGGGGAGGTTGGDGGSGIVIVSYPIPTPALTTIVQTGTVTITAGQTISAVTPVFGTGGVGPRTFNVSPSLPDGLIFNISNGEITGSAEDIFADEGLIQTSTFAVTVIDSTEARSTSTFDLTVIYPPTASILGGTIIEYSLGGTFYKAHRFNSSEVMTVNSDITVEYLVIGGGGGGGSDMGGGGGAGGYLSGSVALNSGTYNIIVGAGGTGGPAGTDQVRANNGNSSSIVPVDYKGHSYIFDGVGDYISIASGMNVDAQDFTIQVWVYPVKWSVEWNSIFSTRATNSTAGATNVWVLGVHNSGYPYIYSGAFQITGAAGQVTLGSWTHLMVTRSGSTMRLFVNGTLVQTSTSSQNYSSAPAAIGANQNGTEQWTGAISNLQIIKGTALYTDSFTVPSVPLELETGTILLTAQDLSLKDNSTNNHTLTGVGNVETSHFNPFNNLGALGGGGGASDHTGPAATSAASWGGSGGGAGGNNANSGLGVSGQGNNGSNSAGSWYPGGGGGADTAGSTNPANGGNGRLNNILGVDYYWAGGGGGGGYSNWGGNGGLGGGGGGAPRTGTTQGIGDTNGVNPAQDATAGSLNSQTNVPGGNGGTNTGGGGGGGSHYTSNNFGGTGGSGIVVIRYAAPPPAVETYKTSNENVTLNFYIPNSGIIPVAARYGTKPYTYSISPALPTGLSLNTSNGRITGQPQEAVAATYTVTVTDAVNDVSSTSFFLTASVNPLYALSLSADVALSISSIFAVPFTERVPAARVLKDLKIEVRQGLTEWKYDNQLTIKSLPNFVYGYTSTNLSLTVVDHSTENNVDLYDRYQHYYGQVVAGITDYVLGSAEFLNTGTYTWTVPEGVTSISVGAIGGGGGGTQKPEGGSGGSGGNFAYRNNITVVPGQTYTIVVGSGGAPGTSYGQSGGDTYIVSPSNEILLTAQGGAGAEAIYWYNVETSLTISDSTPNFNPIVRLQAADPLQRPLVYTITSGTLPPGMSLDTSNGEISGQPQSVSAPESYTFGISASISGQTINRTFTITINPSGELIYVNNYGNTDGTALTGSFTVGASVTYVTVYGCAGGGSGAASPGSGVGGAGGGGAESQMLGYTLDTTPGETLTYSIGSHGQATTISRSGSVIFTLSPGNNASGSTAGTGASLGAYGSHAGGAGSNATGRFGGKPADAPDVTGCAGGGGGAGGGDNSPLINGGSGAFGGGSTGAGIFSGRSGGEGGTPGQNGESVELANGGDSSPNSIWMGGGGGSGAGIAFVDIHPTYYFGAGGGGSGGWSAGVSSSGAPGCLYVKWKGYTSATELLNDGITTNGSYKLYVNGLNSTPIDCYVNFDLPGGPYILVMVVSSSNNDYGYDGAVWTNNSGGVNTALNPDSNTNQVSSLFYTLATTRTGLSLGSNTSTHFHYFDHTSAIMRNLANGELAVPTAVNYNSTTAAAGTGLVDGQASAPGGWIQHYTDAGFTWNAGATYFRYGWSHGTPDPSGYGYVRFGHSADLDSSDSRDRFIGVGLKNGGSGPLGSNVVAAGSGNYSNSNVVRTRGWLYLKN